MPPVDDFLFEDDFTRTDWKESILEIRTDTLSRDRSLATITIICPFAKYKAASRFILGYSYKDETLKLRRLTPVYHPVWTWLYASKISEIAFSSALGKTDGPFADSVPFTVYLWARITIEFTDTAYLVFKDDQVTTEDERYVETKNMPFTELVNVDPGLLKYVAPSFVGTMDKSAVQVPVIRTQLEKNKWKLIWREVPLNFIEDANGNQVKLKAIQKKVNLTTFWGKRPGVLLCESVETTDPKPMPIAQEDFQDLLLSVDVTFNFLEWDPEPADSAVAKYGWNLQPGQRQAGAGGASILGFYYATDDGTLTGKPQWASYEFAQAFTAWNA